MSSAMLSPTVRQCPSTHGAAGYAPGSRRDPDDPGLVICGVCGESFPPPRWRSRRTVRCDGWRGWLLRRTRVVEVVCTRWPDRFETGTSHVEEVLL